MKHFQIRGFSIEYFNLRAIFGNYVYNMHEFYIFLYENKSIYCDITRILFIGFILSLKHKDFITFLITIK